MPKTIVADLDVVRNNTACVFPMPKNLVEVYVRRFLMAEEFAKSCASKHPYDDHLSLNTILKHILNMNDGNAWAFQYDHVVKAVGISNAPQIWENLCDETEVIELDAVALAEPVNLRRTYQKALDMHLTNLQREIESRGTSSSFEAAIARISSPGSVRAEPPARLLEFEAQPAAYAAPTKPAVPARATFNNHTQGEAFGAVACAAPTTITRKRT